jgi:hypothetical protein
MSTESVGIPFCFWRYFSAMKSFLLAFLLTFTLASPTFAQNQPAPALRFFAVPWLERNRAWQSGSSNSYYRFHRNQSSDHVGGGLAVEMMPSPTIGIGIGLGVVELGGSSTATYKVDEFFTHTSEEYTISRDLRLTYVRAPAYLRFTPHLVGPLRAYLLGGAEIGLLLKVQVDGSHLDPAGQSYADAYRLPDAALLAGAGFEYWLNANTALLAGVRYRYGFVGIQELRPPRPGGDYPAGLPLRSYSVPADVTYPLYNRSLSVEVGVKFGPRTSHSTPRSTPAQPPTSSPIRTM